MVNGMLSSNLNAAEVVLAFVSFLFISKRCLRYLRYFQQEEYTPTRFIDWLKDNSAYDKKGTIISAILLLNYFNENFKIPTIFCIARVNQVQYL